LRSSPVQALPQPRLRWTTRMLINISFGDGGIRRILPHRLDG
jgi:hypothetical protein